MVQHWFAALFLWPTLRKNIDLQYYSFDQHCARFAGTHRYACSHSSPHNCAAVACFRLML